MYSFTQFAKSRWSFVVYQKERYIYRSRARELKPLIKFLEKTPWKKRLVIYDKVIGRAAALLLTLIKPQKVLTCILSDAGKNILQKYQIQYLAKKMVKHVMNYSSRALCRWEQLAKNKTPREFWQLVKNK